MSKDSKCVLARIMARPRPVRYASRMPPSPDNNPPVGKSGASNASVNPANLRYSGTPNFANIGNLSLNSISANGGNINIGAAGNSINLATDALQIAADKNITLSNNLTVTAGTLNANAVAITGGTIGGVTVAATTLTVDDISIDGNQITSTHADGISFADENLATSGAITAGSLSAPTISGVSSLSVDNIWRRSQRRRN
ncbi:MAG: hypothetical protein HAW59_03920 [Betaproteobacteria bacterium]|nr:hypothetical protein [Betaproteobacteria bacterium]